jgi:hypothetical protein
MSAVHVAIDSAQVRIRLFSVFSDERGEFSVFSQAVQSFTTAC